MKATKKIQIVFSYSPFHNHRIQKPISNLTYILAKIFYSLTLTHSTLTASGSNLKFILNIFSLSHYYYKSRKRLFLVFVFDYLSAGSRENHLFEKIDFLRSTSNVFFLKAHIKISYLANF